MNLLILRWGIEKYMSDIDTEYKTPIQDLGEYKENHLYIKREDLIPFSFGGNKARKAQLFFKEIAAGDYDCVVTYGSGSSNHCRVVANECCRRGMRCHVISPLEASNPTFNSQMMEMFGAEITVVPVNEVHATIEGKLAELRREGKHPYFIEGGGHGNTGTEAYIQCYQEIREYEAGRGCHFEYIFHASGTGTTQAGLVCGALVHQEKRFVVGISIARKKPYGRNVVIDSIKKYLMGRIDEKEIQDATLFIDDYAEQYGAYSQEILNTVKMLMMRYGMPSDATYTGKAFLGMTEYMCKNKISGKNILFIHTGGTPLYFDALRQMENIKL